MTSCDPVVCVTGRNRSLAGVPQPIAKARESKRVAIPLPHTLQISVRDPLTVDMAFSVRDQFLGNASTLHALLRHSLTLHAPSSLQELRDARIRFYCVKRQSVSRSLQTPPTPQAASRARDNLPALIRDSQRIRVLCPIRYVCTLSLAILFFSQVSHLVRHISRISTLLFRKLSAVV